MIVQNMILIVVFTVSVIDLSGIITSIKKGLAKWLKVKDYTQIQLPLIQCSLCMSFHIQWIYLLIVGQFTMGYLTLAIIFSLFTPQIGDFITLVKEIITNITDKIYKIIR